MKASEATEIPAGCVSKSGLGHFCLPERREDPQRKLAWVNSICILFLLVGILGERPGSAKVNPVSPMEEVIVTLVEPLPSPPQAVEPQRQDESEENKPDTPQVVVVTPETPNLSFAVPTIGNLLAPNAVAQPPPLEPLRPVAPLKTRPASLNNTGGAGERPQPPYPRIALQQGQQGTVTLSMTADDAGNIVAIEVKESSGFPVLDRSTLEYVKRRWQLPRGIAARVFETSITYHLAPD